jgi:hypothetical protein
LAKECTYCRETPRGIDGHDALFIVDIRPGLDHRVGMPTFRCSVCGSVWARLYQGGGSFLWEQPSPKPRG